MKAKSVALAGMLALLGTAASAQTYVERRVTVRPSGYVVPPAPQGLMTADEINDYRMDQLEGRHDAEERAMEMRHHAERRALDPDD